jgi:UDP-glucuronate 4-epimerase
VPGKPGEGGPICEGDTLSPVGPYRLINIGGGRPVRLGAMIDTLEQALGLTATRIPLPLPPGDVSATQASTELLQALVGSVPETPIAVGVPAFVRWYRDFYRV